MEMGMLIKMAKPIQNTIILFSIVLLLFSTVFLIYSLNCGHYTSYAHNNGTWLHFNDHNVREVRPDAVAEAKPYILFYVQREMRQTL